eukprot:1195108-Prorocentrum_minimum.AAC.4
MHTTDPLTYFSAAITAPSPFQREVAVGNIGDTHFPKRPPVPVTAREHTTPASRRDLSPFLALCQAYHFVPLLSPGALLAVIYLATWNTSKVVAVLIEGVDGETRVLPRHQLACCGLIPRPPRCEREIRQTS